MTIERIPHPAINPPEPQAANVWDRLDAMNAADRRQAVKEVLAKVQTAELVDVLFENVEFEDLVDLFENELEQEIG